MQILIKNNNAFIEKNKKTLATLKNHISTLEATIAGMKARDEKFDAAIKALSAISTTTPTEGE